MNRGSVNLLYSTTSQENEPYAADKIKIIQKSIKKSYDINKKI